MSMVAPVVIPWLADMVSSPSVLSVRVVSVPVLAAGNVSESPIGAEPVRTIADCIEMPPPLTDTP